MSLKDAVKRLLIRQQDKRYEKQLNLRRVDYDQWVETQEAKQVAERTNTTSRADDIVLFVQKSCRLGKYALDEIQTYFAENPQVELLYGDEDLLEADGTRSTPWYKPCWSPDLYCACFYLGSVIAVRKELYERALQVVEISGELHKNRISLVVEFENVRDVQKSVYALIKEAGGFRKGCNAIGHVDYILGSVEDASLWQTYLDTPGELLEWIEPCDVQGTVSVIIPSKDNPEVLKTCLDSLDLENRERVDVVLVDNGSREENKKEIESFIASMPTEVSERVNYIYAPMEFNFSRMCNMGAAQSKGDFLLFLNDDMEMCQDDWLEVMLGKAAREHVGAVGLKLYYPDSVKMQHAGIVNTKIGPMHKLQFLEDTKSYYFGRNRFNHDCVAVTGACLMIAREKFDEVGGFKEELRVAYNDVEIGFALLELGYQNVVINERYAYHHESLSRGNDDTREKIERLAGERKALYSMHPAFDGADPYYSKWLNSQVVDFRIAPDYVNAKNTLQKGVAASLPCNPEQLKWDKCLMVGIEINEPKLIQGYSVVLGDDNACYEKYLALIPIRNEEERIQDSICVKLEGQYRQDLEENLPDQVNVALCGFAVNVEDMSLSEENYIIAIIAINRVTGLKLINRSGKYLETEEQ